LLSELKTKIGICPSAEPNHNQGDSNMRARLGLTLIVVALLTGCVTAPQKNVGLSSSALAANNGRVGVAMVALPKVDTQWPGAACLLCYAFASASNSQLTSHTNTLSYEDLPQLKNELAELIRKKGVDVIVIPEDIDLKALPDNVATGVDISKKDFSSLGKKYGIDRLLVVEISSLGMVRTYSSYVPTSDPKGTLKGKGYLVNLKTNSFDWYLPVDVDKSSEGKWDEPPKYPGLTNAYFQALEIGKDKFREPFAK
jgi:hypothetical protein